jgi:hypothetical protein
LSCQPSPVGDSLIFCKEKVMRSKLVFTVAAIAVVGIALSALAQQQGQRGQGQRGQGQGGGRGGFNFGGGGGGGGFLRSRISFLMVPELQKELELADEQVAAIQKVNDELREKYPFGGGRGPGGPGGQGGRGDGQKGRRGGNNGNEGAFTAPVEWYFVQAQAQQPGQRGRGGFGQPQTEEERARMQQQRLERAREEKAKLAEILLPQQLKRLNEIFIQQNGVNALQDEDIAKELGVSDAQKAKLAEVQTANEQAFRTLMGELFQGGGGGGDREARQAKMDELRKSGDAKVLAVLSSDQQKKFAEMKGKPFAMPENAGFGGGRGGPGGRGGDGQKGRRGGNN